MKWLIDMHMSYYTHFLTRRQFNYLKILTLPLLFFIFYALYGLYTENFILLTLYKNAPQLEPTTVLSFFLLLVILWCLLLRKTLVSILLICLLIGISLLSIIENNYGITFLLNHSPFFYESIFTPLSNQCSISFISFGIVCYVFTKKKLRAKELVVASFLLWFPLSIAQLSLISYFFYQPDIENHDHLSLSLPTTIMFIYVAFFFAVWILFHVKRLYPFAFSRWMLVTFILIGVTGGYSTWSSAYNLESAFFRYMGDEIALMMKNSILEYASNKRSILQNGYSFLEHPTKEHELLWKRQMYPFLKERPEIILITAYIPKSKKYWEINPSDSFKNQEELLKQLENNPNKEFIIDAQTLSPTFIIATLFDDPAEPWVAMMIDINTFINRLMGDALDEKVGISITWGDQVLFFKYANDQKYRSLYEAKVEVNLTTPPIIIEVWPTTSQYEALKTPLPSIILAFDISALFLALIILYYAELARVKGDQYRQAETEKTAFFANVSHEIRTQLQGILGTESILEKTTLTEKQQKMVSIIKASGKVLQRLLNDLLDVTKFELGSMKLNPKPTSVTNSIREVVILMTPKAEEKGLKLNLKIDPNIPHTIIIDNDRFEQIISNLISNAIKFTMEGSINVSVKTNILDESNKTMLIVSVQDTGIGIPPEAQKRIFEKFYQVQSTRYHAIEGTGLGLSISKMLAEYMHGAITCESMPDSGSIFTLMLPVEYIETKKNTP